MEITTDDKPIHDIIHGRWLCSDYGIACDCARDHPGDYVCTYERDELGNMINIQIVHDPHASTSAPTKIIKGRIRGVRPSELDY